MLYFLLFSQPGAGICRLLLGKAAYRHDGVPDRLSLSGPDLTMPENLLSFIVTITVLGMIESVFCGAPAARMVICSPYERQ